jgi:integrase
MTVPAANMKGGKRSHVVPLTKRALELLTLQRDATEGDDFVWPGTRKNDHIERTAFVHLKLGGCTLHGFRASLRQYLTDETDTPNHIAEMCLAHAKGVEGAYRRGDSLAKRGAALKLWCDYVTAAPLAKAA